MEALVFMLTFASIYYAIVWINRYFYRRSHMGNLGREEDYVYYCGYRGGVKESLKNPVNWHQVQA
jgi:hypothetical protein